MLDESAAYGTVVERERGFLRERLNGICVSAREELRRVAQGGSVAAVAEALVRFKTYPDCGPVQPPRTLNAFFRVLARAALALFNAGHSAAAAGALKSSLPAAAGGKGA